MKRIFFIFIFSIIQIILFGQDSIEQLDSTNVKDTCKILSINIDNKSMLSWTTKNEAYKHIFFIEQFRWNKWVKVGEVEGLGTPQTNEYHFQIIPYTGENKVRVTLASEFNISRTTEWWCKSPEIKFTINKDAKEIQFSKGTLYELYDSSGNQVKKGFGQNFSYKDIPKGSYILNYDNSTSEIKL